MKYSILVSLLCLVGTSVGAMQPSQDEINQFYTHIDDVLDGRKPLGDLQAFLQQGKVFPIDSMRNWNSNKTLGDYLDDLKCHGPKGDALNALAILRLEEIRKHRTKAVHPLEDLLVEALLDPARFNAFKEAYEKKPGDINTLPMSIGKSMLSYLEAKVITVDNKDDVTWSTILSIAKLVDKDFSTSYVLYILMLKYGNSASRFADLEAWFAKFPCDVDKAIIKTTNRMTLGELLGAGMNINTIKNRILQILEMVRPFRAQEMKEFRELFKKYEQDATKFTDLKKWFDEHPFDIDKVAYDPAEPKGETFGQRVNWLNATNLRELFKAKRSTPNASVYRTWLTPKKMFCVALGVSAVLYYYYSYVKHAKADESETKDNLPVAAIS